MKRLGNLDLRLPRITCALAVLLVMTGCETLTRSKVSVDYYQIKGNTTAALDREIKRKGPVLGGGKHAVAVARIAMVPNLKFERAVGRCRIGSAKIAVNARVTLPSWRGRRKADPELGRTWDNIDRYTRLHEAVHVAMAFRYAKRMEAEISQLPAYRTCGLARSAAERVFTRLLKEHDNSQKAFDRDEEARLAKFARGTKPKS